MIKPWFKVETASWNNTTKLVRINAGKKGFPNIVVKFWYNTTNLDVTGLPKVSNNRMIKEYLDNRNEIADWLKLALVFETFTSCDQLEMYLSVESFEIAGERYKFEQRES